MQKRSERHGSTTLNATECAIITTHEIKIAAMSAHTVENHFVNRFILL